MKTAYLLVGAGVTALLVLGSGACTGRSPAQGAPLSEPVPEVCTPRRAPPALGVLDSVVDDVTAQRVLSWRRDVEEERMLEELNPALVRESLRLEQSQIALGCVDLDDTVDVGRALFLRTWTRADGWGGADTSTLRRVQRGTEGGPDALSCQSCHWKGGAHGAGDRADNAYLFGDGDDVTSADARNAPALWGAGWVELAAQEISAEIQAQAEGVRQLAGYEGATVTRPLASKGISFGTATASPDGTLDLSGVVGVDPDLVVKPFGLKGTHATLRSFVGNSLAVHLGLEAEERFGAGGSGGDSDSDGDGDGVVREITEGQLTSLVALLATLDAPPLAALDEGPYREPVLFSNELEIVRSPEYTARWLDGFAMFGTFGCASCHVPFVPVEDARYRTNDVVIDLAADGARPVPERDDEGRWLVPAFTDFKRHDMGPALAGRHDEAGVPASMWLTKRLWGVALTSPYLHNGAAITFDEAVSLHGGEAEEAARNFALADEDERVSLRLFLASLARAPSVRIR